MGDNFGIIFVNYELCPSFAEIANTITENGGKIVDLDEPKLTHVIIDRLDATRRLKLIERTSQCVLSSHYPR